MKSMDADLFCCGFVVGEEREVQKNYWAENSADLTVEAMMLDSKAVDLDKEERPEVILFFVNVVPLLLVRCVCISNAFVFQTRSGHSLVTELC